jgi:hypothetical protein
VAAQAPSSNGSAATQGQQQSTQDMMKMHTQMMAQMKAADVKLDALIKEMDTASDDAKVVAIAAVVTELVRQNKSMHEHMDQMRPADDGRSRDDDEQVSTTVLSCRSRVDDTGKHYFSPDKVAKELVEYRQRALGQRRVGYVMASQRPGRCLDDPLPMTRSLIRLGGRIQSGV